MAVTPRNAPQLRSCLLSIRSLYSGMTTISRARSFTRKLKARGIQPNEAPGRLEGISAVVLCALRPSHHTGAHEF